MYLVNRVPMFSLFSCNSSSVLAAKMQKQNHSPQFYNSVKTVFELKEFSFVPTIEALHI